MKKIVAILMLTAWFASAQTPGTLTLTYNQPQPTTPPLNKGIKNVCAVWIETASGTFIKTKARYVSTSTDDHLPSWGAKAGCANSLAVAATGNGCNVTDASTGATLTGTTTPTAYGSKTITWDGKNVVGTTNGTTVADGDYKIWIESSWNDGANNIHNELIGFTFTKGPSSQHLTPAGDTYINTVVLDWVPSNLATPEVQYEAPAVVIYPVPSTGVFNIDCKNALNEITVYNLLGQEVYSEKMLTAVTSTKQIDLSNLTDGHYVISLKNQNGISNYEIILDK